MKRAAQCLVAVFAVGLAFAAEPAQADCAARVSAAEARLDAAKTVSHREELRLLFDKAAIDAKAGRQQLCRDALVRASALEH